MSRSRRKESKAQRRHIRAERRAARRAPKDAHLIETVAQITDFQIQKQVQPIEARTEAQAHYIIAIREAALTFGLGPAGTGKTYVCAAMAAEALEQGRIERLVLTRPAVEAGEHLGFLPGELEEKFDPYMAPFRDVLYERLGKGHTEALIKGGRIETAPLAYMRGRTFRDCWVILDEAQNTTPAQMKMFLTRIGENAKAIVNGDPRQTDIPGKSGLIDAVDRLHGLCKVRTVEFEKCDVVRSGLVQDIVERYEGCGF